MPSSPSRPIAPLDDNTLERLLAGRLAPEEAPPAYVEVARLLGAAAGPARPEELAGQAAALAAFRAAWRRPPAGREHRPPGHRWRARLVAVGVTGVLAAGGAAVAIPGGPPDPVDRTARRANRPAGTSPARDPLLLQRPPRSPAASTTVPSDRVPARLGGRAAGNHGQAAANGKPKHDKPKHDKPKPAAAKPKPKKPKRR